MEQKNIPSESPRNKESSEPLPLGQRGVPAHSLRWLSIAIRTAHIGVAALLFGGLILAVPFTRLTPWHHLTILTGCLLMALEWQHDVCWPHRGKGLLALLHLSLCALIHVVPALTVPLLWAILISGSVGSHMPRRFRHWSMLHGWERREGVQWRG
jgi:hypothetical protein